MVPRRIDARVCSAFALLMGSLSCALARTNARVEPGNNLELTGGATVFLAPGTGPDRSNSQTLPFAQVDVHRSGMIGETSGWSFGAKLPLPVIWLGAFDLYGQLPSGPRWAHGLGIEIGGVPASYYAFTRDLDRGFATLTLRAMAAREGGDESWTFALNPQFTMGFGDRAKNFFWVVSFVRVLGDAGVQINPAIFDNDETDNDYRRQWLTFGIGLHF